MAQVLLLEATDAFTSVAVRGKLDGVGVAVVAGPPVKTILEMTNIAPIVPVVATREDALRVLGVA